LHSLPNLSRLALSKTNLLLLVCLLADFTQDIF
jgi:hypothetical protein